MCAQGLTPKEIQARLDQAKQKNQHYSEGKILCSMCTSPRIEAKVAHEMFLDANIGDPALFSGTAELEKEAVRQLSEFLHGPSSSVGFIVSGGTEANLLALYSARNNAKKTRPEVVVPSSAHFSFTKICDMLGVKLVEAPLDSDFRVDPEKTERLVNDQTVTLVGNAGSAELGTVDPIGQLSEIAVKHNVPLHVDAAFGGLVLPFLKELGYAVAPFDFALDGVQSMTVDPHKMGFSTIPAGGILFRNAKTLAAIQTPTPYLNQTQQATFIGTRSGASAAATWAVFNSLGREGFREIVRQCMDIASFLCSGLEEAGLRLVVKPTMNIVGFRSSNSKALADKLRQKGWFVSYVPRYDCIRIVLMPHTTKQHIADFLKCLKELQKN